jgi:hypothetical protein
MVVLAYALRCTIDEYIGTNLLEASSYPVIPAKARGR